MQAHGGEQAAEQAQGPCLPNQPPSWKPERALPQSPTGGRSLNPPRLQRGDGPPAKGLPPCPQHPRILGAPQAESSQLQKTRERNASWAAHPKRQHPFQEGNPQFQGPRKQCLAPSRVGCSSRTRGKTQAHQGTSGLVDGWTKAYLVDRAATQTGIGKLGPGEACSLNPESP